MASGEAELGAGLGIWNSWNRDAYRNSVFLGWPPQNGSCCTARPRLFERNLQQRGTSHDRPNCDGFLFHFVLLGALGNEQWRGVDFAGRENGSALDGSGLDRRAGPNRKPNPDLNFHSDR